MIELVYACGDSFTAGMEILGDSDKREENKNFSYPGQLSRLLKSPKYINNAFHGASNDFITRQTIKDLLELERQGNDPSKTLVTIGWSSIYRSELYVKDTIENFIKISPVPLPPTSNIKLREFHELGVFFVNPNFHFGFGPGISNFRIEKDFSQDAVKFCTDFLWNEELEFEKWYSNAILLKNFLENKGYKFLFVNNVHPLEQHGRLVDSIDELLIPNYYNPRSFHFQQWCMAFFRQFKRKEGHYAEEPHKKFAETLFNYIQDNGLLS